MPIKKSAIKAQSTAERRTAENRRFKKRLTEATKVLEAAAGKEKAAAHQKLQGLIDRAVKRNIFHRNKAARLQSRLAKSLAAKS